jgi:DNA-binding HxlR family transcriptional regulator
MIFLREGRSQGNIELAIPICEPVVSKYRKTIKSASGVTRTPLTEEGDPCPIVATIKLLRNQWNMIAVRYLHDKPMKFNQLKRAMGGVSSKTLSRTLKHLIKGGLVQRRVLETAPISVEYRLTERGMELSEALFEMKKWGRKWLLPEAISTATLATGAKAKGRSSTT